MTRNYEGEVGHFGDCVAVESVPQPGVLVMFLMRSSEASQQLVKLVLQLASTALQHLDSREGGLVNEMI